MPYMRILEALEALHAEGRIVGVSISRAKALIHDFPYLAHADDSDLRDEVCDALDASGIAVTYWSYRTIEPESAQTLRMSQVTEIDPLTTSLLNKLSQIVSDRALYEQTHAAWSRELDAFKRLADPATAFLYIKGSLHMLVIKEKAHDRY